MIIILIFFREGLQSPTEEVVFRGGPLKNKGLKYILNVLNTEVIEANNARLTLRFKTRARIILLLTKEWLTHSVKKLH